MSELPDRLRRAAAEERVPDSPWLDVRDEAADRIEALENAAQRVVEKRSLGSPFLLGNAVDGLANLLEKTHEAADDPGRPAAEGSRAAEAEAGPSATSAARPDAGAARRVAGA